MNEQEPADKLDALLRGWAERRERTLDPGALKQRVIAAIREEASNVNVEGPRPTPAVVDQRKPRRNAAVWFSVGAAAVTLVVACWLLIGGNGKDDSPAVPAGGLPPRFAWLDESQLGEKSRLIRELERIFDNRLQWIAETDGRVLLEVQDQPVDDTAQSSVPLAVRIVVVRRSPRQPQATPVWAVDVVTHQERVIRLSGQSAGLPEDVELRFWVYPVDEDMVAVDSSLSLATSGLALDSNFSGVQRCGEPFAVYSVERSGVEYDIYQTVARLDEET